MDTWFSDKFSEDIWRKKYAGIHKNVKDYFYALADKASLNNSDLRDKFYSMLINKRFSPGGRILAAIGRPSANVSWMNCTTHAIKADSIEAISEAAYKVMRASSRGQGIGIDLSKLRPADAPVNNSAITSTGSISFMELINHAGGIIGQQGRRAALLFSLDINHPDIFREDGEGIECPKCKGKKCLYCEGKGIISYDFLHVKKIPGKVENANISVNITDAFMEAVKKDKEWNLVFEGTTNHNPFKVERTVKARKLFEELAKSAFKSAEPGVLFVDTTRRMSNSDLFGEQWKVVGVNACTEQLLDQEGVCNLGSINMSAYVENPFTSKAKFDLISFVRDVKTAVIFLDNVLTIEYEGSASISQKQRESIRNLRRIGLGVMGFADTLAMLGLKYSLNKETKKFINTVFEAMRDAAYEQSVSLAQERGCAKAFIELYTSSLDSVLEKGFFKTLPMGIKKNIYVFGLRNVTLLSVAPTGSISNLFGVSSGIEPLFALEYTRRVRMNGGEEFVNYVHPAVIKSREAGLSDNIWDTAYSVSPEDHILIQAEIQKYIDQSISKTTNLPAGSSPKDVEKIYMLAYEKGLKGVSVYVDGSRETQVLYNKDTCPVCPDGGNIIGSDGCKSCTTCGWSLCT